MTFYRPNYYNHKYYTLSSNMHSIQRSVNCHPSFEPYKYIKRFFANAKELTQESVRTIIEFPKTSSSFPDLAKKQGRDFVFSHL